MPELPEVETTKRGIKKALIGQCITQVWYSGKNLRYPVNTDFSSISGKVITDVTRRAKYLIVSLDDNTHLLFHLGMSGMMSICSLPYQTVKHDHVMIYLSSEHVLVFHDPRRFGCFIWIKGDINAHALIKKLGPQPFDEVFSGQYLKTLSKDKKTVVKAFIMNNDVVVGVGNIYASEALFKAGIHPHRAAGRVSLKSYEKLVGTIIEVLDDAIKAGGTTLKDFHDSDGKPGYFQQKLMVYGRNSESCFVCQTLIQKMKTGQRSSFFCPTCQK